MGGRSVETQLNQVYGRQNGLYKLRATTSAPGLGSGTGLKDAPQTETALHGAEVAADFDSFLFLMIYRAREASSIFSEFTLRNDTHGSTRARTLFHGRLLKTT